MADQKQLEGQQIGVPLSIYQERYHKLDPAEVTARTGVSYEPCADGSGGVFTLTVLGHKLRATWPAFTLEAADTATCPKALVDGEACILMIRYLLEGRIEPSHGGFLPYRELPWGEVYDKNFQGRCRLRLAYGFGSKPDTFAKACDFLGGVRHTKETHGKVSGDVAYDLPFLPGLTVRLQLWSGDDEFPPQSQWLFSDNVPLAFSAEDVAVIGDVIIGALKEISKKL